MFVSEDKERINTFPPQELDECLLIFRKPYLVIHGDFMSAMKANSHCVNLVSTPTIGLIQ